MANILKTEGIVLGHIKYKESSIIVRIFTQEKGLLSLIVNGVRSSKAKNKIALYQPLTILDLELYYSDQKDLHRLKEARISTVFSSIMMDSSKMMIGIFVADLLQHALKEEGTNEELFAFIKESLQVFDLLDNGIENFHLQFGLKLCRYLGFGLDYSQRMAEEINAFYTTEQHFLIDQLNQQNYGYAPKSNGKTRTFILNEMIKYYRKNIENFGQLQSIEVLQAILNS